MSEFFILLLLVVLVIWLKNSITSQFSKLNWKIDEVTRELKKLQLPKQTFEEQQAPPVPKPAVQTTTEPATAAATAPPSTSPSPSPSLSPSPPQEIIILRDELSKSDVIEPTVKIEAQQVAPPVFPPKLPKPPKPGFFESHPDLEKFIGENLINKIGIAILVLGISFFVKYAIDKDWINEIGRTFIGILAGGLLIAIAHRMRKSYSAFSSVLIGGGLSVLYFTIYISFHEYQIFNQTIAFIIMIVITAFAVMLSLSYNRIELAVLALIGGFSSPFMVSTSEGNYIVLFTYMMILNCGMLVLAYFKKWNLVNYLCYAFTLMIFGGWQMAKIMNQPNAPYTGALIFASMFYVVFLLMNIVYNLRHQLKFTAVEFILLMSTNFFYYASGMSILQNVNHGFWQGTFTIILAVINMIVAGILFKRQNIDRNLIFLFIGMVLTFVSLTAPVQLNGNYITIFWAAEAVLILWLSQKSGIKLMKVSAFIVLGLMLMSLFMDWSNLYIQQKQLLEVMLNKGFITGIVSIISVGLFNWFLGKEDSSNSIYGFPLAHIRIILYAVFAILIYSVFVFELKYQLEQNVDSYLNRNIILSLYNFSFICIAFMILYSKQIKWLNYILVSLASFALLLYILVVNHNIIEVRNLMLITSSSYKPFFYTHYLIVIAAVYLLSQLIKFSKAEFTFNSNNGWVALWLLTFVGVFLASAELDHINMLVFFRPELTPGYVLSQSHKIGFPVLWGISSFILMYVGMNRKNRMLRIISLSLFFITILKLFLFDIRGVSEGGKILAFISLGVLLLVVSFMYQRLKKLILDDDRLHKENPEA